MIKKILFLSFIISSTIYSQEKKILLQAKLIDSLGVVKNANIININSNQGTSSSNTGTFKIHVSLGDSLKISSIQHQTKTIIISSYANKIMVVTLKLKTYTLDEFELKKHNLTGNLSTDSKAVPKSKKDSILKNTMNFSNVNFNHIDLRIDENIRAMPPINNTDPNKNFEGLNIMSLFSSRKSKGLKAIKKKELEETEFPNKIMSELGEDFFFKQLKIPKESYFHFLEYCNSLGIKKLYKKGRLLDVIKILQEESISYLRIIKKNN